MPRPIQARIHTDAMRHNLQGIKTLAPDSRVWAVVKANAYGHGVEAAFEGFRAADGFACLNLEEAQTLRGLGWRGPVLLLEGCFDARDLELCSRLGLWHVVHHDAQIDALSAHKTQVPHHVFLKMNSGMNRLGFAPERFRAAWSRLNALPQVDEVTLMSHFSDADGPRGVAHQVDTFARHSIDLPGERSLCNSAGVLRHASAAGIRADWVRPGIALYGASPDHPEHRSADWGLQPTMSLVSELIAVQALQPGDTVGYGSSFTAPEAMWIGIAAGGYADGLMRSGSNQAPVQVAGVRTQLVGRVSMDMCAVDLRPLIQAGISPRAGLPVTFWGQGDDGVLLPIDEVAQACGTIAYELMCGVTARVPKVISSCADQSTSPTPPR